MSTQQGIYIQLDAVSVRPWKLRIPPLIGRPSQCLSPSCIFRSSGWCRRRASSPSSSSALMYAPCRSCTWPRCHFSASHAPCWPCGEEVRSEHACWPDSPSNVRAACHWWADLRACRAYWFFVSTSQPTPPFCPCWGSPPWSISGGGTAGAGWATLNFTFNENH